MRITKFVQEESTLGNILSEFERLFIKITYLHFLETWSTSFFTDVSFNLRNA